MLEQQGKLEDHGSNLLLRPATGTLTDLSQRGSGLFVQEEEGAEHCYSGRQPSAYQGSNQVTLNWYRNSLRN